MSRAPIDRRRDLADACVRCCTRSRAAVQLTLPTSVHADRDGLVATYRCRHGHRWQCWFTVDTDRATRGRPSPRVTQPAAQEHIA